MGPLGLYSHFNTLCWITLDAWSLFLFQYLFQACWINLAGSVQNMLRIRLESKHFWLRVSAYNLPSNLTRYGLNLGIWAKLVLNRLRAESIAIGALPSLSLSTGSEASIHNSIICLFTSSVLIVPVILIKITRSKNS